MTPEQISQWMQMTGQPANSNIAPAPAPHAAPAPAPAPYAAPAPAAAPYAAPAPAPASLQPIAPNGGPAATPHSNQPLPPALSGSPMPLTHGQVAGMSVQDINAAWDQVISPQVVR